LYGKTKPPCRAKLVHQKELEETVWGLCEAYISNPDKAIEELKRDMEREAAPTRNAGVELRDQEAKLARNAAAREKARVLYYQDDWVYKRGIPERYARSYGATCCYRKDCR